jgi:hypothetical protein
MVFVIKYARTSKNGMGEELWLKFKDRFGESIQPDRKMDTWIKNKNRGYSSEQIKRLLEENEYIWL